MVSLTAVAEGLLRSVRKQKLSVAAPRLPVNRLIERAEIRLEQYRISLFLSPSDAKTRDTVQGIEDDLETLRALLAPSTRTIN